VPRVEDNTSVRHDRTVASRFVVRTRATAAAEDLFDVSLDIDAHVASMEHSGERAIERVVLVPYLRRLIRLRNAHLLDRLGLGPATDPGAAAWERSDPYPYRAAESETLLGQGDRVWESASREVLVWGVKTRSGFRVPDAHEVIPGERLQITAGIGPVSVREPVEVRQVIREPHRVGFSYVGLPGHPVRGEEAFIVHRRGEDVYLTIRSLTAPASRGFWRFVYPMLRAAQLFARRRYWRALR